MVAIKYLRQVRHDIDDEFNILCPDSCNNCIYNIVYEQHRRIFCRVDVYGARFDFGKIQDIVDYG